jgi:hypothetical protein
MSIKQDRRTRGTSLTAAVVGLPLIQALAGCGGGGGGDQGAMPVTYTTAPPSVLAESGDAWQGRYVGPVTIGGVQYFADALLTADGLIRLYVGGPYDDDGILQQTVPLGSAQLVGTLHGQASQISGDGLVFGQQCAVLNPIRFCAEAGHASVSMAVSADSPGDIQGEISVATSSGTETWSLNLTPWSNYYTQPARQGDLAGHYQEGLAEFSINGDAIISLAADGSLSFQSAGSGCAGSGQSRPHLDGAVSVYDVSLSISGCQAPYGYLNGTFGGLATVSPSDYWDYDVLLRMWLSQQDVNGSGSTQPALTLLGLPQ